MWDLDSLFYDGNEQSCHDKKNTNQPVNAANPKCPPSQELFLTQAFTDHNSNSHVQDIQTHTAALAKPPPPRAKPPPTWAKPPPTRAKPPATHDIFLTQAFQDHKNPVTSHRSFHALPKPPPLQDIFLSQAFKENTRPVKQQSYAVSSKPPSIQDLFLSQALKKTAGVDNLRETDDDLELTQAFTRRKRESDAQSLTKKRREDDHQSGLCYPVPTTLDHDHDSLSQHGQARAQDQDSLSQRVQARAQRRAGVKTALPFCNSHDQKKGTQKIGVVAPSKVLRDSEGRYGSDLNPDFLRTPDTLVLPDPDDQGNVLKLKPTSEVPEKFRGIFPFPYFNAVQSKVFNDVFYSEKAVVLCAPTGSGKTVTFELAILRLMCQPNTNLQQTKIIYMAPIKALCSERFEDWSQKFTPFGLQCRELTGDTVLDDYYEIQDAQLIFTTPEKWDSMTRRWRDNKSLVHTVRLFLIDEVHMLNDESRGATMEVVVSRMKTLQQSTMQDRTRNIRFLAVSATVPNVQDVADWLTTGNQPAIAHKMDETLRPVRLRKVVLGYPCAENTSLFRFDLTLNYKLSSVIETYSEQKPTLVFCATRKGVQQAAGVLVKETKFFLTSDHKQSLQALSNNIKDSKLRDCFVCGVGFHHAGLDMTDRKLIETIFSQGALPVLLATSTLAMGVNLPAHLVVVKATQHYVGGVYQEYSQSQILQMIGRAGRPQFDVTATAVIMTRTQTKQKYDALLGGTQLIESSLQENLIEHLNAEIVLNTIRDVSVALHWIKSTFLYFRILKNPKHYNIPAGLTETQVESRLHDLCLKNINALASIHLVTMDTDGFTLQPTDSGRLMARYCVCFQTMKNFNNISGTESLNQLLCVVCESAEFSDVILRTNEKKTLNLLNKDKNRITVRYPLASKVKTSAMKVNVLLQATFGSLSITDFGLQQDVNKLYRSGLRVVRCMVEVLWQGNTQYKGLYNAVLLCKCFKARLWENSNYVAKQLAGIGNTLATALVNAGVTTFQKLDESNPRDIEFIVNRHPPFGNMVKDAVARLPKYELCIDQVGTYTDSHADLNITVTITNPDLLLEKPTAEKGHTCVLLIGDADNSVVYKAKISDVQLLRDKQWSTRVRVKRPLGGDELSVNYISQDWVGLDVQNTYTPFYTGPKMAVSSNMTPGGRNTQQNTAPPSCGHRCLNKHMCGHDCCKQSNNTRVTRQPKVPNVTKENKNFELLRSDLKHKMKQCQEEGSRGKRSKVGTLEQFSYTPRAALQSSRTQTTEQAEVAPLADEQSTANRWEDQTTVPGTEVPTATGWEDLEHYQNNRHVIQQECEEELETGNYEGYYDVSQQEPGIYEPTNTAIDVKHQPIYRDRWPQLLQNEGLKQHIILQNNEPKQPVPYLQRNPSSVASNVCKPFSNQGIVARNTEQKDDTNHNILSRAGQFFWNKENHLPHSYRNNSFVNEDFQQHEGVCDASGAVIDGSSGGDDWLPDLVLPRRQRNAGIKITPLRNSESPSSAYVPLNFEPSPVQNKSGFMKTCSSVASQPVCSSDQLISKPCRDSGTPSYRQSLLHTEPSSGVSESTGPFNQASIQPYTKPDKQLLRPANTGPFSESTGPFNQGSIQPYTKSDKPLLRPANTPFLRQPSLQSVLGQGHSPSLYKPMKTRSMNEGLPDKYTTRPKQDTSSRNQLHPDTYTSRPQQAPSGRNQVQPSMYRNQPQAARASRSYDLSGLIDQVQSFRPIGMPKSAPQNLHGLVRPRPTLPKTAPSQSHNQNLNMNVTSGLPSQSCNPNKPNLQIRKDSEQVEFIHSNKRSDMNCLTLQQTNNGDRQITVSHPRYANERSDLVTSDDMNFDLDSSILTFTSESSGEEITDVTGNKASFGSFKTKGEMTVTDENMNLQELTSHGGMSLYVNEECRVSAMQHTSCKDKTLETTGKSLKSKQSNSGQSVRTGHGLNPTYTSPGSHNSIGRRYNLQNNHLASNIGNHYNNHTSSQTSSKEFWESCDRIPGYDCDRMKSHSCSTTYCPSDMVSQKYNRDNGLNKSHPSLITYNLANKVLQNNNNNVIPRSKIVEKYYPDEMYEDENLCMNMSRVDNIGRATIGLTENPGIKVNVGITSGNQHSVEEEIPLTNKIWVNNKGRGHGGVSLTENPGIKAQVTSNKTENLCFKVNTPIASDIHQSEEFSDINFGDDPWSNGSYSNHSNEQSSTLEVFVDKKLEIQGGTQYKAERSPTWTLADSFVPENVYMYTFPQGDYDSSKERKQDVPQGDNGFFQGDL